MKKTEIKQALKSFTRKELKNELNNPNNTSQDKKLIRREVKNRNSKSK